MRKINFIFPIVAFFSILLLSCSSEKKPAEMLNGAWQLKTVNDNPVPESAEEVVYTFEEENKGSGTRVYNMEHEQGESTFTYEVDGEMLLIEETTTDEVRDWEFKFSLQENSMKLVMGDTMTFAYERLK